MELLTLDFCTFLLKKKLTDIKITQSREIKIDFKPPVPKNKPTPSKNDALK